MDLFAWFSPGGRTVEDLTRVRRCLLALTAHARSQGWYAIRFSRTWNRDDLREVVVFHASTPHNGVRDESTLGDIIRNHGLTPLPTPARDEVPTPLWNTTYRGEQLPVIADKLTCEASSVIETWASGLETDALSTGDLALDLMISHAVSTVAASDHRSVGQVTASDLLSLRLLSFRSHAEGILMRAQDPLKLRAQFEEEYERHGATVRSLLSARFAEAPSLATESTAAAPWSELVRRNYAIVRGAFAAGGLYDESQTLEDLNADRDEPLVASPFHAVTTEDLDHLLHHDPDFLAYRVLTSLLYSSLHTAGVGLPERYVYCYIIGRGNEDVTGLDTHALQDKLHGLATAVGARSRETSTEAHA